MLVFFVLQFIINVCWSPGQSIMHYGRKFQAAKCLSTFISTKEKHFTTPSRGKIKEYGEWHIGLYAYKTSYFLGKFHVLEMVILR